jgi:hypothetical protein
MSNNAVFDASSKIFDKVAKVPQKNFNLKTLIRSNTSGKTPFSINFL